MLRLAHILAALAVVGGCGPTFDPQSTVVAPRILAIVADAPELAFDGTTRLTAVLAFPDEVAAVAFAACPLSLGAAAAYACATPDVPLVATGATATFDAALAVSFLDGLPETFGAAAPLLKRVATQDETCLRAALAAWDACRAATGADPTACDHDGGTAASACLHQGGLDVMVHVTATLADGTVQDAYKRVRLRDPSPERPPNHNPGLLGVTLGERVIHDGDTIAGAPGAELTFVPQLAPDAVESYVDARGAAATEQVFVSWFATGGEFEYIRSLPDLPDDRLTLPATLSLPITVWVVAHDDRYGASVLSFTVAAEGGTP